MKILKHRELQSDKLMGDSTVVIIAVGGVVPVLLDIETFLFHPSKR